jgi:hypothetical protein
MFHSSVIVPNRVLDEVTTYISTLSTPCSVIRPSIKRLNSRKGVLYN